MNFWSELRRRSVFRVATAYAVIGWLIIQVVSVMVPALRLPDYLNTVFAIALLIGFPVALVLAWVYDVTPDGIVRTDESPRAEADRLRTIRRLDGVVILGLLAIAGLLLWQRIDPPVGVGSGSADSIAVLPFEDLSPQGDQRYFADGVSEEILNALARQSALTVTGRTSSFVFRDSQRSLREIGATLGVAVLLEGSVRKQADRVRIVARLVRSNDGTMLWTETFDARLDNIFAVQERVADGVIQTLAARSEQQPTDAVQGFSFAAYDDLLRARELVARRTPEAVTEAESLLKALLPQAPDYAPPLALLAQIERLMTASPGGIGNRPVAQSTRRAIDYAERALVLDPELADARAVRGLLYLDEKSLLESELALRRALEINPSHTNARLWLSLCLTAKQRYRDAVEQLALLFERDPMFMPSAINLSHIALGIGESERIPRLLERLGRIDAPASWLAAIRARRLQHEGRIADSATLLRDSTGALAGTGPVLAPLAMMLLRIGDTAGATAIPLPFTGIRAALVERRYDDAVTQAQALLEASDHFYIFQIEYLRTLALAGRDEALVAYVDARFGDLESFERSLFWGYDVQLVPYWTLAYALHRSGEAERLEALLARWQQSIDVSRANGADNLDLHLNEARWFALRGEHSAAIAALKRAGSPAGGLITARLRDDYLSTLLAGDPDFTAVMARNLERVNAERAALDLPPLA